MTIEGVVLPPRPLRVAYVDHCAKLSGAEIALLRLLPHLEGVEPVVVLGEEGPLVGRLNDKGIRTEVVPLPVATGTLGRERVTPGRLPLLSGAGAGLYSVQLARRLRRLDVDIVHTNSNKAHLYGGVAARLARRPQVWHARDRVVPEFMPMAAVRLTRLAARTLPRVVIANSRSTLATLPAARHPRGPSAVLPDPIVDPPVPRAGNERPFTVVMVGRLAPWKGQDVFLRSFAEAFGPASGQSPARALVVGAALFGEDDYADALRQLVEELGVSAQVVLTGHRDDVAAILADADVLVHASIIPEPFGQVIVEGLLAGLPVVAADAGGPAEILDHERTGLLVPPRDVPRLAEALLRLRHDPVLAARLATAGRSAAEDYRPGPVARQLEAVYHEVVA